MAETLEQLRSRKLTRDDIGLHPASPYSNLQRVLGTTTGDVGTICCVPSINMWAKYAPIEYESSVGYLLDEHRAARNHGFSYQQYNNIVNLFNAAVALSGCAWTRSKPQTWFRLMDFIGYRHTAGCPFPFGISPTTASSVDRIVVGVGVDEIIAVPDFSQSDFNGLTGFNAGVAWREQGTTGMPWYMTFNADEGATIPNSGTWFKVGKTYDIVFFFTNQTISDPSSTSQDGIYYLAPYPLKSMAYISGKPDIEVKLTMNDLYDTATIVITSNKGEYALSSMYLTHANGGNLYTYDLGSATVTASGTTFVISLKSGDSWLPGSAALMHLYVTYRGQQFDYNVYWMTQDGGQLG